MIDYSISLVESSGGSSRRRSSSSRSSSGSGSALGDPPQLYLNKNKWLFTTGWYAPIKGPTRNHLDTMRVLTADFNISRGAPELDLESKQRFSIRITKPLVRCFFDVITPARLLGAVPINYLRGPTPCYLLPTTCYLLPTATTTATTTTTTTTAATTLRGDSGRTFLESSSLLGVRRGRAVSDLAS